MYMGIISSQMYHYGNMDKFVHMYDNEPQYIMEHCITSFLRKMGLIFVLLQNNQQYYHYNDKDNENKQL
jgi:hypothetical protein